MIAPPSYLYEVSSARAPEGFHSVKEEPQRKDFQVDFPFENPTGYKKPTAKYLRGLACTILYRGPQDFGLLGFFCARFPPREARVI